MASAAKVLRVGTLTAISTLDPRRANDFTGHVVISQVFESPYARIHTSYEPRLAAAAPVRRPGGDGFEIPIRTDVRFSDGSPVTAEQVAASVAEVATAHGAEVGVQGHSIVLRGRNFKTRPEEVLSTRRAAVIKEVDGTVLGTGPFAVAEASARGVRLVRNPHATRRGNVDEIVVQWYAPSPDGRPHQLAAAVESGEVDFTLSLSRDDVAPLQRVRKLFQPGMSAAILSINSNVPELSRVAARRAIAHAIDRYKLTELCYSNAAGFVARCLLPPGLGRGNDGLRHDPEAARAALGDARLPARMRMVRVWGPRPYLPRPDAVAAALVEQLAVLGTTVEVIATTDSEQYNAILGSGDYELVLGGWVADTADPVDFLESTVGSSGILVPGRRRVAACNFSRWHDPETDRLLAEARSAPGGPAIDAVLARVAAEVPLVPLMYGPRVIVHSWRVKGYDPDAGIMPDFAILELDG